MVNFVEVFHAFHREPHTIVTILKPNTTAETAILYAIREAEKVVVTALPRIGSEKSDVLSDKIILTR